MYGRHVHCAFLAAGQISPENGRCGREHLLHCRRRPCRKLPGTAGYATKGGAHRRVLSRPLDRPPSTRSGPRNGASGPKARALRYRPLCSRYHGLNRALAYLLGGSRKEPSGSRLHLGGDRFHRVGNHLLAETRPQCHLRQLHGRGNEARHGPRYRVHLRQIGNVLVYPLCWGGRCRDGTGNQVGGFVGSDQLGHSPSRGQGIVYCALQWELRSLQTHASAGAQDGSPISGRMSRLGRRGSQQVLRTERHRGRTAVGWDGGGWCVVCRRRLPRRLVIGRRGRPRWGLSIGRG